MPVPVRGRHSVEESGRISRLGLDALFGAPGRPSRDVPGPRRLREVQALHQPYSTPFSAPCALIRCPPGLEESIYPETGVIFMPCRRAASRATVARGPAHDDRAARRPHRAGRAGPPRPEPTAAPPGQRPRAGGGRREGRAYFDGEAAGRPGTRRSFDGEGCGKAPRPYRLAPQGRGCQRPTGRFDSEGNRAAGAAGRFVEADPGHCDGEAARGARHPGRHPAAGLAARRRRCRSFVSMPTGYGGSPLPSTPVARPFSSRSETSKTAERRFYARLKSLANAAPVRPVAGLPADVFRQAAAAT